MALTGMKLVELIDKPNRTEQQRRRDRLHENIGTQIERTNLVAKGGKPRGLWWWKNEDGKIVLTIKYGRHTLELAKGKRAILCDDTNAVIVALERVEAANVTGAFDDQLAELASSIRANFAERSSSSDRSA